MSRAVLKVVQHLPILFSLTKSAVDLYFSFQLVVVFFLLLIVFLLGVVLKNCIPNV